METQREASQSQHGSDLAQLTEAVKALLQLQLAAATEPDSSLTTKEKIDILLKEYDALRAEMVARLNARVGFFALFLASVAFVFGNKPGSWAEILAHPRRRRWLSSGRLSSPFGGILAKLSAGWRPA